MLLKKYMVVVIGIIICLVNGHKEKSSLTFVIDITKSMSKEIEQVKNTTDIMFDKIFNSRTNNIDNFVLVTFGDPDANVAVKTRDRNEFKQALQNIELQSGGYCPEASMTGIILALKHSHRNSFLYVFTDAAAADYENATIVKSLSQKRSTQVNFLLTGKCKFATDKQNLVYDEIAETTSGHIFNIQKDEVSEIINFVVENLKSKTTVLRRKLVEDNFNKMIEFTIDSKISNVFICVSSSDPRFFVYNSKGTAIKVLNVVKSQNNSIVKLEKELNEQYFIKLDQNTRTLVTVTSSTSICFQHGFSTSEPMSLDETSIKPSGKFKESHFLSIQLENDARDIMLEKAELVDVNDNIIFNTLPLNLIDDEEQFYSTQNAYKVPYGMFRIAVIGTSYSGEIFRRVSITTIQRPDPEIEIKEEPRKIIPEVIILAKPNIHIELKKRISVTCKVRAVPVPDITWVDTYGQKVHPKIVNYDSPYYGSVLNIEKVDNEGSLTCIATNAVGTNKTSVNITIIKNMSTAAPVVYEAIIGDLVLQIPCNAISEGSSVANVKWEYKLGEKTTLLSKKESDEYIIDNNANLILKNIKKNYEGFYKCSVESLYGNDWTESEVLVKEHIIPLASHLKAKTALLLGTNLSLPCDNWLVDYKGYARWYKDGYFIKNCSSEELCSFVLVNAALIDTGIYTCRISTIERSISVHKQIIVYTNLNFINEVETTIAFKENELAFFDCNSYGVPTPEVTWSMGSRIISKSFTISFIMKIDNIGQYECKVSNEMGGLIHRTFEIKSDKECQLNMTFHRNMPLYLNHSAWIIGPVKINTKIEIMCIDSVISDTKRRYSSILVATCLEKTSFKTKEYGIIDVSELKCEKEVDLKELKGNEKYCVKEPSNLISIMLPKKGGLIGIFDVCVDKHKNVTYFIQYKMTNGISKNYAEPKHMSFKSEDDLGCRITADKKCCFVKKHLISVEDMLPGLQQIAVHHYSNFVPQWSSCGTENWDEVGRRVRSLCTTLGTSTYLEVWIGISQLTLINDKYDEIHHVPRYIWKVIFNKNTLEGLAIIVENFPHASDHSCKSPCNFICNKISWMKGAQWQNPSKGCVFCCSLGEFMNIFHYENIFPNTTKLLI